MIKAFNFRNAGKTMVCITLLMTLILVLAGCGGGADQGKANQDPGTPAAGKNTEVSKANPLVVDKEAKTVKVYTEVNGKYFVEPTRHGIVFKDGSNGNKSILKAYANQNDFYNALVEINAKPGNNLQLSSTGVPVEGDKLNVTVTWAGANKELPFGEIVTDSTNRPFDIRFGGNQQNAKDKNTGCILCLDSCPVGITSNAAHPTKDFDSGKARFYGNKDVLPQDGTPVIVTFKVQ